MADKDGKLLCFGCGRRIESGFGNKQAHAFGCPMVSGKKKELTTKEK